MLAVAVVTALVCLGLYIADHKPLPVAALGGIVMFLVFALWDPPPKHKDFTYEDQIKGTARARGGSGPPEIPEPDIPRRGKGR
jgi:hypothetical protein